jgi:SAM-dependent methyltransferase
MSDLSERVMALSPERRRLFERLLKERQQRPQLSQSVQEVAEGSPVPNMAWPQLDGRNQTYADFVKGNLTESNPNAEIIKDFMRRVYTAASERLSSSVIGDYAIFLNYGYVADSHPQLSPIDLPEGLLNRHNIRLILEVIGEHDLTGREVLDISCGRGGNLSTIGKYYQARRLVGLDITRAHIQFCKTRHAGEGSDFLVGDAEKLPFGSASFDVVINVEASGHYPNLLQFYVEVFRMLRPGGYFLYTDLFSAECISQNRQFLKDIGFALEREQDITSNVLLSCDESARRHVRAFGSDQDQALSQILAIPGSTLYEDMKSGRLTYRIFNLKKQTRH